MKTRSDSQRNMNCREVWLPKCEGLSQIFPKASKV